MQKVIVFNKTGYDPFISFLKAYSIVCVVLAHAIPSSVLSSIQFELWGDMQVPIFFLIQTFHSYKKGVKPSISLGKLWQRILKPFLIVEVIIILFYFLTKGWSPSIVSEIIHEGGKGPGSYYPWIYLQMAILLPVFWPLFKKFSIGKLLFVFIITCFSFDILLSLTHFPDWIYRLTAIRYIFLIFLGAIWVKDGIILNYKTIIISIISIGLTLFFYYNTSNLEPWFYSTSWKTHRWPCYFYASSLLCWFLYLIYEKIKNIKWVDRLMILIANSSYEIFLVQMGVFVIIPSFFSGAAETTTFAKVILFLVEIFFSIGGGVVYHRIINKKIALG